MKQKLTKRIVEAAESGPRDRVIWDTEVTGFGLKITPRGRKVYVYAYRDPERRQRKLSLGKHGDITCETAREAAKDARADIAKGANPAADKVRRREAIAVADLCDRYMREHADVHKKASSAAQDRRLIEQVIKPAFGRLKVATVTRDEIASLHQSMQAKPYQANRTRSLLSKMFNMAEVWGLRPDNSNPCRHVQPNKEAKRERYLTEVELARLGEVLREAELRQQEPWQATNAIRLLLLTGCRLNEILTLRWEDVDFDASCLRLRDTKTGARIVPVGLPVLELLSTLSPEPDNPYVIPSERISGGHLTTLKKPWQRLRKRADIEDVRLHDLRRSNGTMAITAGVDIRVVQQHLGHTDIKTTERYAQVAGNPARQAAEVISQSMAAALNCDSSSSESQY